MREWMGERRGQQPAGVEGGPPRGPGGPGGGNGEGRPRWQGPRGEGGPPGGRGEGRGRGGEPGSRDDRRDLDRRESPPPQAEPRPE
jgi:hypothetical protein